MVASDSREVLQIGKELRKAWGKGKLVGWKTHLGTVETGRQTQEFWLCQEVCVCVGGSSQVEGMRGIIGSQLRNKLFFEDIWIFQCCVFVSKPAVDRSGFDQGGCAGRWEGAG